MEDLSLLANMALVLTIALFVGLVAHRLKIPSIVGYLATGIVIGPHVLGLISDVDDIETLATVGVVLLMFTLGMEFSIKALKHVGVVAILGGIGQIVVTAALGLIIAKLLGKSLQEAVLFGFFISLSSSIIVLKILSDREELRSPHGRIMTGILLIQDLSVVPMMAILPALGDNGTFAIADVGWAILKAGLFLGTTFVLGFWGFPWFIKEVAGERSRELFLLTIVCICFGAGFAADRFGLSVALGAFLAGLMISESEYAHEAIADIRPLRDTFAVLFFVSLGMLADFSFVADNPRDIVVVVFAIVIGKFLISAAVPRLFGYSAKTTVFVGSGLFQIGEFSFILAALALEKNLISEDLYSLTLTAAFFTMLLTPFALGLISRVHYRVTQARGVSTLVANRLDPEMHDTSKLLSNHVVICGYGRVARHLLEVLDSRNISSVVVDIDPRVISAVQKKGIPSIYGNAGNLEVLAATNLKKAKVLVIAMPDPIDTKLAMQNAIRLNPEIDVVARVHWSSDIQTLRMLGVSEIVRPEIEAGLEIIRHILYRYEYSSDETDLVVNHLREVELGTRKPGEQPDISIDGNPRNEPGLGRTK